MQWPASSDGEVAVVKVDELLKSCIFVTVLLVVSVEPEGVLEVVDV